ncbi:ribonuclease P protein component [bacterium]|nr:ribonuclease P protein component [bacterium]
MGRLTKRAEFLYIAAGLSERRRHVVVQARRRRTARPEAGVGFTATRKVGNAVIRNRAKRRLREAARAWLPTLGLAGADYVLIARSETATGPWARLLDEVESALLSLRRRLLSGEDSDRGGRRTKPARDQRAGDVDADGASPGPGHHGPSRE